MTDTSDVVIVGGGVVGSGAGYQLRQDGFTGRITVIERDSSYARASSNLAMGGIRQQFGSAINIRMVQHSVSFYERFDSLMKPGPGDPLANFRQRGYLFLTNAGDADRMQKRFERQQQLGAVVERLDRDALRRLIPGVFLDDIEFGIFGPRDGYANPRAVLRGFRRGASAAGVEYVEDEVARIERDGARVGAVIMKSGRRLATSTVINAAGAFAAEVGRAAGLELPVQPVRQHLFRAELPAPWATRFPMVIDPGGVHWRHDEDSNPGHDRIVVARTKLDEPAGPNLACDESRWVNDFRPDLVHRVPAFRDLRLVEGWAGLYEMTPDHNPIIGEHPDLGGFFVANGFSGHGLMMAPATATILSDLVRTGRSDRLDIRPFDVGRFARGELFWDEAMI